MAYIFVLLRMRYHIFSTLLVLVVCNCAAQTASRAIYTPASMSQSLRLLPINVANSPQKSPGEKAALPNAETSTPLYAQKEFTAVPSAYYGITFTGNTNRVEVQLKPTASATVSNAILEIFSRPIRLTLPSGNAAFMVSKNGVGMKFYIFRAFQTNLLRFPSGHSH